MAKLTFYSVTNCGRFQDDSDDGFPTEYFEKMSEAKSYAADILDHYQDEGEFFEVCRHEANTYSSSRWAVVNALNRQLYTQSVQVGTVRWNPKRGGYFVRGNQQ